MNAEMKIIPQKNSSHPHIGPLVAILNVSRTITATPHKPHPIRAPLATPMWFPVTRHVRSTLYTLIHTSLAPRRDITFTFHGQIPVSENTVATLRRKIATSGKVVLLRQEVAILRQEVAKLRLYFCYVWRAIRAA